MLYHRNSPKRFYEKDGVYFITTNTINRYPYFVEDLLCRLFLDNLEYCRKLKNFKIIAYKINPDHLHLLIQTGKDINYSEIMHNLKRNYEKLIGYQSELFNKYGVRHPLPAFKWHKSFYCRLLLDTEEFVNHVEYIRKQYIKHDLGENKYCFTDEKLFDLMI